MWSEEGNDREGGIVMAEGAAGDGKAEVKGDDLGAGLGLDDADGESSSDFERGNAIAAVVAIAMGESDDIGAISDVDSDASSCGPSSLATIPP